ncbi:hypothetical protein NAL19_3378 [Pectobacterium sp. F1-1]|nr:hypothetical protein NAL19_3378 [Pectobacterium sp. F1-1]
MVTGSSVVFDDQLPFFNSYYLLFLYFLICFCYQAARFCVDN